MLGWTKPDLEPRRVRERLVDLPHAHRAEDERAAASAAAAPMQRPARRPRLDRRVVSAPLTVISNAVTPQGPVSSRNLNDQRVPGLRDPLAAREHLRHEQLAGTMSGGASSANGTRTPLRMPQATAGEQQENERARGAKCEEDQRRADPREIGESMRQDRSASKIRRRSRPLRPTSRETAPGRRSALDRWRGAWARPRSRREPDRSKGGQARNHRQPLKVTSPKPT